MSKNTVGNSPNPSLDFLSNQIYLEGVMIVSHLRSPHCNSPQDTLDLSEVLHCHFPPGPALC